MAFGSTRVLQDVLLDAVMTITLKYIKLHTAIVTLYNVYVVSLQ